MFKKTFIAVALTAILATPTLAGNNNGPIFGSTTNNYTTNNEGGTGIGIGVGNAKASAGASAGALAGASNHTTVGIGVKNDNFNAMSQSSALENTNQNFNSDFNANKQVQGQSSEQANRQVMHYNESDSMHYSGGYEVKNVPNAIAADISPTVPCAVPLTGAGSGVGFGVSLGTAYIDEKCELRETVRLGLRGDAESKRMANMVIRGQLQGYLDEQREEEMARVEDLKAEAEGTGLVSVFELTDY